MADELTTACAGDGQCTNPRCPRHGIEWAVRITDPTADDYVRATSEAVGLNSDEAIAYRHAATRDYPLTSGQEIDSRQAQRSGSAPVEGTGAQRRLMDAPVLSGPSGSRCEPIAYVCSEPGCEAVFTDPDPSEAWGQYLDHQDGHDMDNDTLTAEVPD